MRSIDKKFLDEIILCILKKGVSFCCLGMWIYNCG